MTRTARKIDDNVLAVLTGAVDATGNRAIITQQLARPDYVAVDKVLRAAGGAWDRKAKAHLFPVGTDAGEVINSLCLTGTYTTASDDGWFPTSAVVADQLVGLVAPLRPGMAVLEPSAGEGALIHALRRACGGLHIVAVELDPRRNQVLVQHAAAVVDAVGQDVVAVIEPCDFLTWTTPVAFDRVVMNPPFIGTTYIDHVMHAFDMLKPGGQLGAVMPAGVRFRQDRKHAAFRAFVDENDGEIRELHEGAFNYNAAERRAAVTPVRSTGVRAVAVVVNKP